MILLPGGMSKMKPRADRISITYQLAFDRPFHCGTGIREGLIDRTVVRNRHGYLYVPGSTFKGVLRERCEQLARMYESASDEVLELMASPHDREMALGGLGHLSTMITRIFGSPQHSGRLYFDDIVQKDLERYGPEEENGERRYLRNQTDIYTQVRLDRPTRTAVPGALYTSEFGLRDLVLEGSITGVLECFSIEASEQNAPTYSLLLLLAGLRLVDRLGGNKSTGKGQCACEISRLSVGDTEYKRENWRAWLEKVDELAYYSSALMEEGDEA
jgi:CRISPR/Cas system CMR subunit Cmr4 (Cas7 group RAMP superfamily)